jgi:putative peptidoglycan lipid II flippase
MLLALAVIYQLVAPMIEIATWRYLALLILVACGMVVYAVAGVMFGAFGISDLRGVTRR